MGYQFPLLGTSTFIVFLLFAIALRVGRSASPYRTLAKLHLGFSLVYLLGCFFLGYQASGSSSELPFSWGDAIFGLYLYFALEYAFFAHVFATIIRGFSINICVAIYRLGCKGSLSDVQMTYADGKGIDYVKEERITVLLESGAIESRDGKLHLTSFGKSTAILNRWILKVWRLDYLGSSEVRTK